MGGALVARFPARAGALNNANACSNNAVGLLNSAVASQREEPVRGETVEAERHSYGDCLVQERKS
jgi:hypothetical protein